MHPNHTTPVNPNRRRPHTVIDNVALRDARLSFKARGLLAYMLTMPDGYQAIFATLANGTTDDEESIQLGLEELKACGYLAYRRVQLPDGAIYWYSSIYDEPQDTAAIMKSPPYLLDIYEAESFLRASGMPEDHLQTWRNKWSPAARIGIRKQSRPRIKVYLRNRPAALAKNNGLCVYCGAPADTVDHVIPRSKGGSHDLDNLVPACRKCNQRKGTQLDWSPE